MHLCRQCKHVIGFLISSLFHAFKCKINVFIVHTYVPRILTSKSYGDNFKTRYFMYLKHTYICIMYLPTLCWLSLMCSMTVLMLSMVTFSSGYCTMKRIHACQIRNTDCIITNLHSTSICFMMDIQYCIEGF